MSVRRWNPVEEVLALRDAVDDLFRESLTRAPRGDGRKEMLLVPPADAWEDQDEVVIELALAGVDPRDIDVRIAQDTVIVRGEFPPRPEGKSWILQERAHGPFERRFDLNLPVDVERSSAIFQNGTLTLYLPKSEGNEARKITVQTR